MGIGLAFRAFFGALTADKAKAAAITVALAGESKPALPSGVAGGKPSKPAATKPADPSKPDPRGALVLLAALQEKGRFLDFLHEDLDEADDSDIGAAARAVHSGCKEALAGYVTVATLASESEGDSLEVNEAIDPSRLRVSGSATPPFTGTVVHPGWKATRVNLPQMLGSEEDAMVLAPTQIDPA